MGMFEDVIQQSSRKPEGFGGVIERRRTKRPPMLRSSRTSMSSNLWELELVPAFGLNRLIGDISDLSGRSVDTNLFFDPDMVLAAWPRLTSLLAPKGCWMLCLWETLGDTRALRLFMPVRRIKQGWPGHWALQTLSNEYAPVGTPLIDRECAAEAVETLFQLLADPAMLIPPLLDMTHLRRDTQTFQIIEQAAQSLGLKTRESHTHERAALFARPEKDITAHSFLGRKPRHEMRRQLRRLEERGTCTFSRATNEEDILDAFERFITLELKGWKGRHGTALYNQKRITAFSRQAVAAMAKRERCEIFTLSVDDKAIASLIVFIRNGHVVPWKVAFDEKFSAFSPGAQIFLHATQSLLDRKTFVEADSLAIADHSLVNRLWPDRVPLTDLMVAVRSDANALLDEAIEAKQRRTDLRHKAKAGLMAVKRVLKR